MSTGTDERFDALTSRRRQFVLHYLRFTERERVPLNDVSDFLIEESAGADVSRGDVTLSLQHVHLPKLDALGMVDYDADTSTVRYNSDPTVEMLLDVALFGAEDSPLPTDGRVMESPGRN